MADNSTHVPVQPAPKPRLLFWAVATLMLLLTTRAIGALLAEVQLATDNVFGGMEALASGVRGDVVAQTQALLSVWRDAAGSSEKTKHVIERTAWWYTVADFLLLAAYVNLFLRVLRHLAARASVVAAGPGRWQALRGIARLPRRWVLLALLVAFDTLENAVRLGMVEAVTAGRLVPDAVIWLSWTLTTLKFAAFAACVALVAVLLYDTGLVAAWWRPVLWALWRLRLAVAASVLYLGLLVGDPTGQVVDLVRRGLDDGYAFAGGVLAIAGHVLLGWVIWMLARQVALAGQTQSPAPVRWPVVLGIVAGGAALAGWAGLRQLHGLAVVAAVVAGLGAVAWLLQRFGAIPQQQNQAASAAASRQADAQAPDPALARAVAVRGVARALAVAQPVLLLVVTAAAYAPVPLVLWLSERFGWPFWGGIAIQAAALVLAPTVAILANAWLRDRSTAEPSPGEPAFRLTVAATVAATVVVLLGATWLHTGLVNPLLVVPVALALLLLLLGLLQIWSETHDVPRGLLLVGLSRVPTTAAVLVTGLVAGFVFHDGSSHAVHRTDGGPDAVVGGTRPGVPLVTAFEQWRDANCAGAGNAGQRVPMVLVAAPGGGLRAAYWTASTLTDMFGADRTAPVTGCPGAAASDRIFAMGGASGGSLGALAYAGGLTDGTVRPARWYERQLARPDYLTDPLAWMLTADLGRAYAGFGGEDRARRLEKLWEARVTGLDDDFFTGTWGLGGRRPLSALTGTQVESGCRLNVGGVRLTTPGQDTDHSCATVRFGDAQRDPPSTSDLLDHLCGRTRGSAARSVSSATAALLSARFPYVSPSGQLYRCAPGHSGAPGDAVPTAIVDGGYADNTGIDLLLQLWRPLQEQIAVHNADAGNATIVPVLLLVDNHYAQVAAPARPARTLEILVPPSTRSRPDQLDEAIAEGHAAAAFAGPVPGTTLVCDVHDTSGRFLRISPRTSPGLPAPLAWSLSRLATDDLDAQRATALDDRSVQGLRSAAAGGLTC